jgi:hypothetical protein
MDLVTFLALISCMMVFVAWPLLDDRTFVEEDQ